MAESFSFAEVEKWAHRLYAEFVDQKDAAGFVAAFVDEGRLRFGNNPPLNGRQEIEKAIAQFFQAMITLRHQFEIISCAGKKAFLEASVTYLRHDNRTVTVPAMTVFELEKRGDELMATDCRIYVDLAPLFAPAEAS